MKRVQKLFVLVMGAILLAANADAGRWLTRDPIEHMKRDPQPIQGLSMGALSLRGGLSSYQQQANLYQFVANNPISVVDPLGLWNLWNPATYGVPNGVGWSLGNSLTPWHESAGWSGFSLQTTSEADAAFLDGLNPFGNPFANMGLYDPCDKALKWSRRIGTATFFAEGALATAGAAFYAPGTSIFYSGAGAEQAAIGLAEAGEGSTIFNTAGGWLLRNAGVESKAVWRGASWLYGNTAGSEAIVVVGEYGGVTGTALADVEFPVLAARGVNLIFQGVRIFPY